MGSSDNDGFRHHGLRGCAGHKFARRFREHSTHHFYLLIHAARTLCDGVLALLSQNQVASLILVHTCSGYRRRLLVYRHCYCFPRLFGGLNFKSMAKCVQARRSI
jgi:hypothetical protein